MSSYNIYIHLSQLRITYNSEFFISPLNYLSVSFAAVQNIPKKTAIPVFAYYTILVYIKQMNQNSFSLKKDGINNSPLLSCFAHELQFLVYCYSTDQITLNIKLFPSIIIVGGIHEAKQKLYFSGFWRTPSFSRNRKYSSREGTFADSSGMLSNVRSLPSISKPVGDEPSVFCGVHSF